MRPSNSSVMIIAVMELEKLAASLQQAYPQGLPRERDALVTLLMQKGYSRQEAVAVARALEAQGYAHFLPGEKPRFAFTSRPVDLKALMRALDQEYPEFVGEGTRRKRPWISWPPDWRGTGRWPRRSWRP